MKADQRSIYFNYLILCFFISFLLLQKMLPLSDWYRFRFLMVINSLFHYFVTFDVIIWPSLVFSYRLVWPYILLTARSAEIFYKNLWWQGVQWTCGQRSWTNICNLPCTSRTLLRALRGALKSTSLDSDLWTATC